MVTVIHRKKLLPTVVMLLALIGMSLSLIGEAFSHGATVLPGTAKPGQFGDSHNHVGYSHGVDETSEVSRPHDPGNHTHETVDQLAPPPLPQGVIGNPPPITLSVGCPRSFHYRLERPPKPRLTV